MHGTSSSPVNSLQWYITMGANTSKIDTDQVSYNEHLQAIVGDPQHVPSPPPRLPPVQSHETVRREAARVSGWRLLDAEGDIYEATGLTASATLGPVHGLNEKCTAMTVTRQLPPPPADIRHLATKRTASLPAEHGKRRRLMPTACATKIADDHLSDPGLRLAKDLSSDSTGVVRLDNDQKGDLDHPSSAFFQQDTDFDEGYESHPMSPTADHNDDGDIGQRGEEGLIKFLAQIHHDHTVVSTPISSVLEAKQDDLQPFQEEDDELLKHLMRCPTPEQDASAHKIRILREQATKRRRMMETLSSRTVSHEIVTLEADWEQRESEDQPEDVEKLLDIAQHYNMTNADPTTPRFLERGHTLKYVK